MVGVRATGLPMPGDQRTHSFAFFVGPHALLNYSELPHSKFFVDDDGIGRNDVVVVVVGSGTAATPTGGSISPSPTTPNRRGNTPILTHTQQRRVRVTFV